MTTFDPARYKATTREQWQTAAKAWNDWGTLLRAWLGPATEIMLDMARIAPGARVLDVAAGAGDQTLQAAARVGPGGYVLATDIAPNILAFAAANARAALASEASGQRGNSIVRAPDTRPEPGSSARAAGYASIDTKVMDGEEIDVPEGTFDAVISRVGLIYFPDQQKALAGMKRALKAGGRVAAIVYSTPENNRFFSIPVSIIRRRANLPPPLPGQPGPFSLGGAGVLEEALRQAGFRDVTSRTVAAPVKLRSAAECVRFEQESFGALHQMLASLDEAGRQAAWREIETELTAFEGPTGFAGPCELVVAAATR